MSSETPDPSMESFDPFSILFQGSGILAVNKPAGLPVHAGTGHPLGLTDLIEQWVRLNPGALEIAPGKPIRPAHRLDREASGVLLLGLTAAAARKLQAGFAARRMAKVYLAVVAGPVDVIGNLRGKVRTRLRGVYRHVTSELSYRRLRGDERLSLVEVKPVEGRTHQIRELFARAERPLAGDLRYGRPRPSRQFLARFDLPHFLLHALELTLPEEVLGAEKTIRAPMPPEFHKVIAEKGWEPLVD